MRLRFRHAAAITTASTLVLMLLGVLTAATGTGLSCQAQWPFCDGGLFPASMASVPEWAHRAVAMVVGFAILGLGVATWRGDRPKRERWAAAAAVAILPTQIVLGAVTVTLGGLIPGGYSVPVQVAHFATALSIFGLLAAVTAWAAGGDDVRARAALLWSAALVPAYAVVSRGLLFPPSVPMQALSYGVGLALFAALLCAALWSSVAHLRRALAALLAVLSGHLLLGRALFSVFPAAETVYLLGTGVVAAATVLVAALAYRARPDARGRTAA